jgi:hypothetical protein
MTNQGKVIKIQPAAVSAVNARSVVDSDLSLAMEEVGMGRKPKPAEVRARFFTARASGATLKEATAAAGVSKTTGHYWLVQSGGVRPRVRRPRPPLRLSAEERETISRGLANARRSHRLR